MTQNGHEHPTVVIDDTVQASALPGHDATVSFGPDSTVVDAPDPDATLRQPTWLRRSAGRPTSAPAPAPALGSAVRYVVTGLAGQGGMGTVHVAKDVALLRRVALKALAPEAAGRADARARFIREVQVTAQLDHPNVVPVYSLEVAPGDRPAYTMKLVEGRTFADVISAARHEGGHDTASLFARLEHFLKVCDAIGYAHERGVIHRDLKPANLMVGAHNEVYVMDWGLCRVAMAPDVATTATMPDASPSGAATTRVGDVVGTPRYMSPEQARGHARELDARSDQYSLGLILLELITLEPARQGRDLTDVLSRASKGEHAAIARDVRAPRELVAIVDKALAPQPEGRYSSVDALAADLRRYLRGDAVVARPDTPWQSLLRTIAHHRQGAGLAALGALVIVLAIIAGLLWRHERMVEARERRELRVQELTSALAGVGDQLQTRLLGIGSSVQGLARVFEEAARHGESDRGTRVWRGAVDADGAMVAETDGGPFWFVGPDEPDASEEAEARRLLGAAAAVPTWLTDVDNILAGVAPAGSNHTLVRSVELVTDTGVILTVPQTAVRPDDSRSDPWYSRCALQFTSASPVSVTLQGGSAIDFCTPLFDPTKHTIGRLRVTVDAAVLLARVEAMEQLREPVDLYLLDPALHVAARHPVRDGMPTTRDEGALTQPAVIATMRQSDVGLVEVGTPPDGIAVTFDRIHPFEWILVAVRPSRTAFPER